MVRGAGLCGRARAASRAREPAAVQDSFGEVLQRRFASTPIPTFSHGEQEEESEAITTAAVNSETISSGSVVFYDDMNALNPH